MTQAEQLSAAEQLKNCQQKSTQVFDKISSLRKQLETVNQDNEDRIREDARGAATYSDEQRQANRERRTRLSLEIDDHVTELDSLTTLKQELQIACLREEFHSKTDEFEALADAFMSEYVQLVEDFNGFLDKAKAFHRQANDASHLRSQISNLAAKAWPEQHGERPGRIPKDWPVLTAQVIETMAKRLSLHEKGNMLAGKGFEPIMYLNGDDTKIRFAQEQQDNGRK